MANLITIEQLLESVDLDFVPRWVTKDKSGDITMFLYKPTPEDWCGEWRGHETTYSAFGAIKLSEFENKHWTECIYEVPRKTTEKIKEIILTSATTKNTDMFIVNKINELVGAVNKHADIIQQIGEWASSKGECLWSETLTKFEPTELKGVKNE